VIAETRELAAPVARDHGRDVAMAIISNPCGISAQEKGRNLSVRSRVVSRSILQVVQSEPVALSDGVDDFLYYR